MNHQNKAYIQNMASSSVSSIKANNIFYAEAVKGYTFKVTIDSLANAMQRTVFNVTKEGFFCRASDEAEQILYDINFPRENFRPFVCSENISFSLNLKHLQKMVRNVKKKDSIIIFIEKSKPDKLYVSIKPSSISSGHNSRLETLFVVILRMENEDFDLALPEIFVDESGKEIKVYGYSKAIDASDFQKMKKMTTLGKLVKISVQSENYISFCSDNGKLYGSNLEFGEIIEDDEEGKDEEDYHYNKGLYEAEFHMNIFSLLMKLPGLCKLMNFYSPRIPRYPLKIQMNAENLGQITIYIKDAQQIAHEQSKRESEERQKDEGSSLKSIGKKRK